MHPQTITFPPPNLAVGRSSRGICCLESDEYELYHWYFYEGLGDKKGLTFLFFELKFNSKIKTLRNAQVNYLLAKKLNNLIFRGFVEIDFFLSFPSGSVR